MMTITEIAKLADWSEGTLTPTRLGPRILRKITLATGCPFWTAWKSSKEELKARGVYVRKDSRGNWEATWEINPDPNAEAALEAAQAKAVAERRATRANYSNTLAPALQARLNKLKAKLLAYQIEPVKNLTTALNTFGGAVDASDTGTGKTYVTVAAAAILQRPLFVVCPKAVIPSWKKVARHFGVYIEVINYELLRRGEQDALTLHNPGKDEKYEWHLPKDSILVFDECHRMKDYRTYNCKMGVAALDSGYTIIGLSATAADNPLQMKFIGALCRLFPVVNFWKWTLENGCQKGAWGFEFVGGNKVLQRIHEEIFPYHGTRIRIADLGDAFPETQITAEVYEMNGNTAELNSIYEEMDAEIARLEAKEMEDSNRQACVLTAQLRARQRAEILKVPALAAMAKDLEEEGMSVAIFCNYDDTVNALMAKLGTDCVVRGGQTAAVREANIQRFQALRRRRAAIHMPTPSAQDAKQALGRVARAPDKNEPAPGPEIKPSPFIICNIRAGGVGIGLHDLNGSKSIQRIFFAAGTIEELVCRQVQTKVDRLDLLNDGDLSLSGESRQQVFLPVK
jgi:superfamily II DNA or RNA helicase